jgi:hypothetical protein
MPEQSRLNYGLLHGLLQQAVNFGIADIDDGNFRYFDTPKALVRHLQRLAADIFAHEKTAPSVGGVLVTRITPNFSEFRSIRK